MFETLIGFAAALSVAAWGVLLILRGGFWHAQPRLPAASADSSKHWPEVAVLIPARDEAASMGAVLESHRASAYPGKLTVIVVDDGSTDGTAEDRPRDR